ncbi:hypothetical protein CDL12_21676 [Handroanthus impetiginosus]|uniref:Uncharacterized protein n=1 Tax=Handroanthus impetiginosus TaxID=429701 RepID=A0A2G9GKF1_9LAMI|nr:hypothetical protein CDL12_21676 [Handroanthus impetiginosus]
MSTNEQNSYPSKNTSKGQHIEHGDSSTKANWDLKTTKVFIILCAEEIKAENDQAATSRSLMNPNVAKFRERGPLLIQDQEMLFGDVVANGNSSWTPSSGVLPQHMQEDSINTCPIVEELQDDDSLPYTNQTNQTEPTPKEEDSGGPSQGNLKKHAEFFALICQKKKKKKKQTTADKLAKCLERMINTMENESSSRTSEATKQFSIQSCLDTLDRIPAIEEGSPLWMYATQLFLKADVRELFMVMRKDKTRLKYLQDQMERDMQRRATTFTSMPSSRGASHSIDNTSFV